MIDLKPCVIDTNIFLRTLLNDQPAQTKACVELLTAVKQNKIKGYIPDIALAEIVWTLSSFYKLSKKDVVAALSSIHNLRGLEIIGEYDHLLALATYKRKNVKYIDCLIASIPAVAQKKWIIVSYDKEFDQLGVIRKTPGELNFS
jgi:predicted nucleic-acid-binding protein